MGPPASVDRPVQLVSVLMAMEDLHVNFVRRIAVVYSVASALFPRSCSEASQFHRLPQGPTRLDVDGSGDLSVSVVDCRYDVTKIPHDMPANTAIRSSEAPNHGLFVLSYMDFSPAKLESLIAHSSNCRQQITYKCNHAPLQYFW